MISLQQQLRYHLPVPWPLTIRPSPRLGDSRREPPPISGNTYVERAKSDLSSKAVTRQAVRVLTLAAEGPPSAPHFERAAYHWLEAGCPRFGWHTTLLAQQAVSRNGPSTPSATLLWPKLYQAVEARESPSAELELAALSEPDHPVIKDWHPRVKAGRACPNLVRCSPAARPAREPTVLSPDPWLARALLRFAKGSDLRLGAALARGWEDGAGAQCAVCDPRLLSGRGWGTAVHSAIEGACPSLAGIRPLACVDWFARARRLPRRLGRARWRAHAFCHACRGDRTKAGAWHDPAAVWAALGSECRAGGSDRDRKATIKLTCSCGRAVPLVANSKRRTPSRPRLVRAECNASWACNSCGNGRCQASTIADF